MNPPLFPHRGQTPRPPQPPAPQPSGLKPSEHVRKGWSKGAFARDIFGFPAPPLGPQTCQWSITGALVAAYPHSATLRGRALRRLVHHLGGGHPSVWQDQPGRTRAEVIAALEACDL